MTKTATELDAEIAKATLRVGQRFDWIGRTFEIVKIGRDKNRTVTLARRSRDPFGKDVLIDHYSLPARDLERQHFKAIP